MSLDKGRPPEVMVRSIVARADDIETLHHRFTSVWSGSELAKEVSAITRGAYKRKAKKINLVDVALPDGVSPKGGTFEREGAPRGTTTTHAGKRPTGMSDIQYKQFKKKAFTFLVRRVVGIAVSYHDIVRGLLVHRGVAVNVPFPEGDVY